MYKKNPKKHRLIPVWADRSCPRHHIFSATGEMRPPGRVLRCFEFLGNDKTESRKLANRSQLACCGNQANHVESQHRARALVVWCGTCERNRYPIGGEWLACVIDSALWGWVEVALGVTPRHSLYLLLGAGCGCSPLIRNLLPLSRSITFVPDTFRRSLPVCMLLLRSSRLWVSGGLCKQWGLCVDRTRRSDSVK